MLGKKHWIEKSVICFKMINEFELIINRFGERFISTTRLYDSSLRKTARVVAKEMGYSHLIQEGVYAMVCGPSYETPAELKLLSVSSDVIGKYDRLQIYNCYTLVTSCEV